MGKRGWPLEAESGRTALAKEVYKALFGKDGGFKQEKRAYRHLCGEPAVSKVAWDGYIAVAGQDPAYGPDAVRVSIFGQQ